MSNETSVEYSPDHLRQAIAETALDRLKGSCPFQRSSDKGYFCNVLDPNLPNAQSFCPYLGSDIIQSLEETGRRDHLLFRRYSCNFQPSK